MEGHAFENICLNNIGQMKAALGISGVSTSESLWSKRGNERERGAQIDLIISCGDSVVNMCWAKFCSGEFSVDRDYHFTLVRRKVLLQGLVPKKGSMTNPVATTQSIPSQTRGADGGTVEGRCGNQIARAAKSSFPILRKISFAIGFVFDLTRGYGLTLVAFHGS